MTSKEGKVAPKSYKVQSRSNTDHGRSRIYIAQVAFQYQSVGIR